MSVVPTTPRQDCRRWNTFGRQRTNETRRIGGTPKTPFPLARKAGDLSAPAPPFSNGSVSREHVIRSASAVRVAGHGMSITLG